jgi:N-acetylglutamate synthase-like GNAT family acetyltransferase
MLTIRQAVLPDHAGLEALLSRASLATGEHVDELLAHPETLLIPVEHLAHTIVAEAGGRILGFCTLLPTAPEFREVDALFIEPDAWRTGLGKTLLSHAEEAAIRDGATALGVVSGRYAEPFYKALGFQPSGTERTLFGPAARLVKPLTG